MNLKIGQILDSWQVKNYAMDLHFQEWDTQGRSESNIPERINEVEQYKLSIVSIDKINEPEYQIDEDSVSEYAEMEIETMPPIILGELYKGKYDIIDGCHRFYAIMARNKKEILAYVPINNKKTIYKTGNM